MTSGTSIVATREYQMCSVIAARLPIHTSVASSSHTTYVTLRGSPVDGAIVARFTQSGAYFGSCFSQIPRATSIPSG